jgi:hypothetical protein
MIDLLVVSRCARERTPDFNATASRSGRPRNSQGLCDGEPATGTPLELKSKEDLGCVRLLLEPSKIFRVLPSLKNRSLIRGRIRGLFGTGPLKFRYFGF